jgi:hypothetical protein
LLEWREIHGEVEWIDEDFTGKVIASGGTISNRKGMRCLMGEYIDDPHEGYREIE